MRRKAYSSPKHKLVAFFRASRDRWRSRAKDYRSEIRRLEVRIRDVESSRDHWRAKYLQRQPPLSVSDDSVSDLAEEPPRSGWVREQLAVGRSAESGRGSEPL
jgi:hypothetical protein